MVKAVGSQAVFSTLETTSREGFKFNACPFVLIATEGTGVELTASKTRLEETRDLEEMHRQSCGFDYVHHLRLFLFLFLFREIEALWDLLALEKPEDQRY